MSDADARSLSTLVQNDMLRFEVVTTRKELRTAHEQIQTLEQEKERLVRQLNSIQREVDRILRLRENGANGGPGTVKP